MVNGGILGHGGDVGCDGVCWDMMMLVDGDGDGGCRGCGGCGVVWCTRDIGDESESESESGSGDGCACLGMEYASVVVGEGGATGKDRG